MTGRDSWLVAFSLAVGLGSERGGRGEEAGEAGGTCLGGGGEAGEKCPEERNSHVMGA